MKKKKRLELLGGRNSVGGKKSIAIYAEHSAFSPPTRDKEGDHLCNFSLVSLVDTVRQKKKNRSFISDWMEKLFYTVVNFSSKTD